MLTNTSSRHPLVPVLNKGSVPVILWNLTPLIGYLFYGWQPVVVFMCYALETVMLGFFNVLKLLVVYKYGLPKAADEQGISGLGIIPFFLAHYYFFVFVQLSIFLAVAGMENKYGFNVFGAIWDFLQKPDAQVALALFTTSASYSFITDFIAPGVYKERTMVRQMFEPYGRIFVQQFVVISGSMLYMLFGGGWFLLVFVSIKTWFDLLLAGRNLYDWAMDKQKEMRARGQMPDDTTFQ